MDASNRTKEIEANMDGDSINVEKYVAELTRVTHQSLMAVGAMLQEESVRTLTHISNSGGGAAGAVGEGHKREPKGVMEYKFHHGPQGGQWRQVLV